MYRSEVHWEILRRIVEIEPSFENLKKLIAFEHSSPCDCQKEEIQMKDVQFSGHVPTINIKSTLQKQPSDMMEDLVAQEYLPA